MFAKGISKNGKLCVKSSKWGILIEWWNSSKLSLWNWNSWGMLCSVTLVGKFRTHLCAWDSDAVYKILTEACLLLIEIFLQMEKTVIIDKRLKLDY